MTHLDEERDVEGIQNTLGNRYNSYFHCDFKNFHDAHLCDALRRPLVDDHIAREAAEAQQVAERPARAPHKHQLCHPQRAAGRPADPCAIALSEPRHTRATHTVITRLADLAKIRAARKAETDAAPLAEKKKKKKPLPSFLPDYESPNAQKLESHTTSRMSRQLLADLGITEATTETAVAPAVPSELVASLHAKYAGMNDKIAEARRSMMAASPADDDNDDATTPAGEESSPQGAALLARKVARQASRSMHTASAVSTMLLYPEESTVSARREWTRDQLPAYLAPSDRDDDADDADYVPSGFIPRASLAKKVTLTALREAAPAEVVLAESLGGASDESSMLQPEQQLETEDVIVLEATAVDDAPTTDEGVGMAAEEAHEMRFEACEHGFLWSRKSRVLEITSDGTIASRHASSGHVAERWPVESLLSARALADKREGKFAFALRVAPPLTHASLFDVMFRACAGPFGAGVRDVKFTVDSAVTRDEIVHRLEAMSEMQRA